MTTTVELTTETGFIYTVRFGAEHDSKGDDELIALARPHAAQQWSSKIHQSAEADSDGNRDRARASIMAATARVIR
jgi:hypothetical protein